MEYYPFLFKSTDTSPISYNLAVFTLAIN